MDGRTNGKTRARETGHALTKFPPHHSYELLRRCDRSMADAEQRNLCQQTEMSLWMKAKSLVRACLRVRAWQCTSPLAALGVGGGLTT